MDPIDQIRSRLPIEEVVARYVTLKKSGRNFKALCPFHQEKTPSFIISPDKGLAYCFGCRKGGDIFAFTQAIENIEFREALVMLAEKAGVALQKQSFSPELRKEKDRVQKALEEAHRFFQEQLKKNKTMLEYVENRGYDAKSVQRFEFGFAPDSFHLLTEYLSKKGFSSKELLDAGLVCQKEVGDEHVYDRFRNRIMFPIHDASGTLIAFGGRAMGQEKDSAKYLNSPETKCYHKGETLYLFHKAKSGIREKDRVIIVEGYFDALMAHLKGFPETVSSLGTALTEHQMRILGRFTKRLFFAFDSDLAGNEAASRSIEIAQQLGYDASVLLMPAGLDPDQVLLQGNWDEIIKQALPAMDFEFQQAFGKAPAASLEGKKKIMQHLFSVITRLPGAVDQEFYLKRLASGLQVSLQSLLKDYQRLSPRRINSLKPEANNSPETRPFTRQDYLLGILINTPDLFPVAEKELGTSLYKESLRGYNPSVTGPDDHLFKLLSLFAHEKYQAFSPEEVKNEVLVLCSAIHQEKNKKRLNELRFQIEALEKEGALKKNDSLLLEYQRLISEIL